MDKFDNFIRFGDRLINLNWVVEFLVTDDGQKVTAILKDAPENVDPPTIEGDEAERLLEAAQWGHEFTVPDFGGAGHGTAVVGSLSGVTVDVGTNDGAHEGDGIVEIGRDNR